MKHKERARMRTFVLAAIAPLLLCQCSQPEPLSNEATTPASLADIEGPWDIVSFDGYRPARLDSDGQRHAFVNIQGNDVAFAIECNYSGMAARLEAGRLVATSNDNVQTEMGCGPEREGRDSQFFAFLRGSPLVAVRARDELVLEREGVRLELQRPDLRRRPLLPTSLSELDGAWRADILYWRSEPGRTDNLLADLQGAPGQLIFEDGQARLTFDCETVSGRVSMSEPGRLELETATATRTQRGPCAINQAYRDRAASILSGVISAEHIPPSRLHIEAGDVYAVLHRE